MAFNALETVKISFDPFNNISHMNIGEKLVNLLTISTLIIILTLLCLSKESEETKPHTVMKGHSQWLNSLIQSRSKFISKS